MKRFEMDTHDNSRVICSEYEDGGEWVRYEDVKELEEKLFNAEMLMAQLVLEKCELERQIRTAELLGRLGTK